MKVPFPVLFDAGQKAASAYGVSSIPTLFVIDKTGKVIYSSVGFDMSLESALALHLGVDLKLLIERSDNANPIH